MKPRPLLDPPSLRGKGLLLVSALPLLMLAACNIGADEDEVWDLEASFTPAEGAAAASIRLEEGTGGFFGSPCCGDLGLVAMADGIAEVKTVAYTLSFGPDHLAFERGEDHWFYDGSETIITPVGPGRLRVTQTVGTPIVPGSGPLHWLQFRALRQGVSTLTVTDVSVTDAAGVAVPGVVGFGGTVVVTRTMGDV